MLRLRVLSFAVLLVLSGMPNLARAESVLSGWGGHARVDMEAWSNGMPVLDLDGDWSKGYRRRPGAQRAYVAARAEAAVELPWLKQPDGRGWRVGALARVDGSARLSGEAAQAVYHYQSQTDPEQPVTLDAGADILYWTGRGASVEAPVLDHQGFKLDVRFEHLTINRLRALQTAGYVTYNPNDTYSYAGTLRDDHSETRALFSTPPASQGTGASWSLALAWHKQADGVDGLVSAPWVPDQVRLRVDDAWSRLRWNGINGDDARLQSDVSELGDARITGQYTRRTVTAHIPVSTQLHAMWIRPDGQWSAQVKHRLGLWQRWLDWQSPGTVRWRVGMEPFVGVARVGVAWQGLEASLMSGFGEASGHVRGLQMSWMLGF